MLELSYDFQTRYDDSWYNEVECRKRSNSIILTKKLFKSNLKTCLFRKDYLQKHVTKKHGDYTLQKLETMFAKMYHIDEENAAGGNSLEEQIKAAVVTFEWTEFNLEGWQPESECLLICV